MRGHDEETGEFFSPSRSAQRRAALDVLELGEVLVALTATQLGKLPIPEELLPHICETQRMTSYGARKRQLAFLAKQMRKLDDGVGICGKDGQSVPVGVGQPSLLISELTVGGTQAG